ncbi:MAG: glutathione S-transferase family protein [Hydrogenophaga sp.]|uniref:glutathione S-transferase family protein n=1 Tax=Hydrogenophaga sp. TaxID=1904254 RepID=UPI002730751C|nr:glutathione S-transferase family protein [Hydrogenophaga sp.]MDP2163510.1 glutathione S-transferase family protein [Hydrogenophaga sp.]
MIQLHHYPSTASMVPHILLEELGVPYERVLVDRTQDVHKTTAYLQLNPNGLIPVLVDGDLVLYETAAICLHLCDTHPAAQLAPPLATHERAHFYKWLMWLTNTLQATLIVYFYPERWVNAGNLAGAAEVRQHAEIRIHQLLRQLDHEMGRAGGPWFMGDTYSALDPYAFTLCRWTRHFAQSPARERRFLGPYLQRMLERPAVQRALASEGLSPPYV